MKGIDPVANSISVARDHASLDPVLSGRLTYECCTMEDLLTAHEQYDAVVASEVVEHVADVGLFIKQQCQLVKVSSYVSSYAHSLKSRYKMAFSYDSECQTFSPNPAWRCGSPHHYQPHPHLVCLGHRHG